METFTVTSSNGRLKVDSKTGEVLECELFDGCDTSIQLIDEFDVEEWKKFYDLPELPASVDILDLGYWYFKSLINKKVSKYSFGNRGSLYEAPCFDWRELVINL